MEFILYLVAGVLVGAPLGWFAKSARLSPLLAELRGRSEELRSKNEALEAEKQSQAQAESQILQRLTPLQTQLNQLQQAFFDYEEKRGKQLGGMQEQLRNAQDIQTRLAEATKSLAGALNDNQIRGSWGEISLRRLLEHSGLQPHVDYDVQVSTKNADGESIRIDAVVKLPDGKYIAIDSKVPAASLQKFATLDEGGSEAVQAKRAELIKAHSKDVRKRVDEISKKEYYSGLPESPEFTVMFIPNESVMSFSLEADPDLLSYAFEKKVALVSPVSFYASMKTIAYSWQQTAAESTIRELMDVGRKLFKNLRVVAKHSVKLGNSLNASVVAYNDFAGSLERNLLTSLRELDKKSKNALSSNEAIPSLLEIEETTRDFVKPEITQDEDSATKS